MEDDKDIQEAIEECSKIVEEKCKRRPYMIILAKADVGFANEEDKKKGRLKGRTSYVYYTKPPIQKHAVSKLLIEASGKALDLAQKKFDESGSPGEGKGENVEEKQ